MSRKRYMEARRRCKRLRKGQLKLDSALACSDSQHGSGLDQEHLVSLRQKVLAEMSLQQLEAWEARLSCKERGISLPPAHRSEGQGYRSMPEDERRQLRAQLETASDANFEALIAEGA